jgi:hypothetical protein
MTEATVIDVDPSHHDNHRTEMKSTATSCLKPTYNHGDYPAPLQMLCSSILITTTATTIQACADT